MVFARVDFEQITHIFDKSKMAATKVRKSISCHIFCSNHDKNTNEALLYMFSGIRDSMVPMFTTQNVRK